jgi:hypothetical protein
MPNRIVTTSPFLFKDPILQLKLNSVLANDMIPIVPVGAVVETEGDKRDYGIENTVKIVLTLLALVEIATEYLNIKNWWSLVMNAGPTISNIMKIREAIEILKDSAVEAQNEIKNLDMPEVLTIVEVLISGIRELLPKFNRVKA